MTDKNNSNNDQDNDKKDIHQDNDKKDIQQFIDEFEKLAEEYNINEYLSTIIIDNNPIMLWRPKDLNRATKMAKQLHTQLHNMVLIEIGDASIPENY